MTKLKQQLKNMRLKQTDLAKQSGVSIKTLNRSCQNGIKTVRVARRYAAVLGCDWRELID